MSTPSPVTHLARYVENVPDSARPGQRRPPRRLFVPTTALAGALFAGLTAHLFVFPAVDRPTHADAIVMFEGAEDRLGKAMELARAGYAPVLVISTPGRRRCPVAAAPTSRVICFSPNPVTTRGEARASARLAARYGWRKILFVTGRAQDTRARIRIGRCYHGRFLITTVNPRHRRDWPSTVAYEWGALAKALIWQRGC
jgi:hypothetical protein